MLCLKYLCYVWMINALAHEPGCDDNVLSCCHELLCLKYLCYVWMINALAHEPGCDDNALFCWFKVSALL